MSREEMRSSNTIVVVTDAPRFLASRKLDIYRFFEEPPRIMLVRRGDRFPTDARTRVQIEAIHLPVVGLEEKKPMPALSAVLSAVGYLLHAPFLAMRLRGRRFGIRLVHAHFIFPQGLFGLILARLWRVPLVISAVGSDVNVIIRKNVALRTICRFVLLRADVTIAVSKPLQRALQHLGIANSVHLPNSVDTKSICRDGGNPVADTILFVGSMTENKRPLLLLRAFQRVVEIVPKATLMMVGDGPLRETVQSEIRRKRLDGRVKLLPSVAHGFVIELLSQAAVFVLPSHSEGLSNALLEAMAAGKVIVASSNESHKEIFRDQDNALLFQVDNETELVQHMVSALTNAQLRSRLSRSARELCVREFSSAVVAGKLERIYQVAISRA
jgi:glycosyltransferase involved in cell wall biosynthesis